MHCLRFLRRNPVLSLSAAKYPLPPLIRLNRCAFFILPKPTAAVCFFVFDNSFYRGLSSCQRSFEPKLPRVFWEMVVEPLTLALTSSTDISPITSHDQWPAVFLWVFLLLFCFEMSLHSPQFGSQ